MKMKTLKRKKERVKIRNKKKMKINFIDLEIKKIF